MRGIMFVYGGSSRPPRPKVPKCIRDVVVPEIDWTILFRTAMMILPDGTETARSERHRRSKLFLRVFKYFAKQ